MSSSSRCGGSGSSMSPCDPSILASGGASASEDEWNLPLNGCGRMVPLGPGPPGEVPAQKKASGPVPS